MKLIAAMGALKWQYVELVGCQARVACSELRDGSASAGELLAQCQFLAVVNVVLVSEGCRHIDTSTIAVVQLGLQLWEAGAELMDVHWQLGP